MSKFEDSFMNLGLNSYIIDMLKHIGYKKPLPIQSECIPLLLKGYDLLGMAHTGSGKTAAFLLPLLQNINLKQSFVQGLIITPTRELAIQISQVCMNFIKYMHRVNIITLYGGQNYNIQLNILKKNPHIIVGTPGRLLDHLNRGTADISHVRTLIIDEADEMLHMGFIEDVERIINKVPKNRQTALFSATLPVNIRKIGYRFMRNNPKEIYINGDYTSICDNIKQNYWLVNGITKHEGLMRFLETEIFDAAIVFVRTKSLTLKINEILKQYGYNSAALNGDMNQSLRHQTVSQLRCGTLNILITTDIAARGLDIHRIGLVINYDIPNNYDDYIHRIGRTGRAGRIGKSLLFVEKQEYRLLCNIKREIRVNIKEVQYPTSDDLVKCRLIKLTNEISHQLDSKDIEIYQSLLIKIQSYQKLTTENLAIALLKMVQNNKPLILPPDPVINKKFIYYNSSARRSCKYFKKENKNIDLHSYQNQLKVKSGVDSDINLYRVSIGHHDRVKVRHIIDALSHKIDIQSYYIGNIRLYPSYSIVEISNSKLITKINVIPKFFSLRILNKLVDIKFLSCITYKKYKSSKNNF